MMSPKADNISSYIANVDAFEAVNQEIASNLASTIPQPVMIVGQEGSGKTTLLRRLFDSYDHRSLWIDGRSIFSSDYIVGQCRQNKASVVFIDDMDYYFSRCSYDEQSRLRRYLFNEGAPMLIASISKIIPALAEYSAPFFDGFKKVYLNPISKESLSTLLRSGYIERGMSMYELLPPTIKSVELINLILQINDNPVHDTSILLSLFSEKFSSIYRGLPTYSQQILNVMDSDGIGLTIPEIREKNALPTNILSAYLTSLRKLDIVKADKSVRKNTRYSIKDPMFSLWLKS